MREPRELPIVDDEIVAAVDQNRVTARQRVEGAVSASSAAWSAWSAAARESCASASESWASA
ncbi:hypothetical protein ACWDFR_28915 [Streptomyces sp. 900105755]